MAVGISVLSRISIHALLTESDVSVLILGYSGSGFQSTLSLRRATLIVQILKIRDVLFQSTLSLRRATFPESGSQLAKTISIHALLAESDLDQQHCAAVRQVISIHALLAESDRNAARRHSDSDYFNPRSPCGERLSRVGTLPPSGLISIHALLAESDLDGEDLFLPLLISIHALLAESDVAGYVPVCNSLLISIHALLAESDYTPAEIEYKNTHFNPRSPCGERRPHRARCGR